MTIINLTIGYLTIVVTLIINPKQCEISFMTPTLSLEFNFHNFIRPPVANECHYSTVESKLTGYCFLFSGWYQL